MSQSERIREAAEAWIGAKEHRTAKELCGKIGVSEQAYYRWLDGNTKDLKAENFMKLVGLTRFNPRYLLWGEAPKMLVDDARFNAFMEHIADMSDADLKKLLDYADLLAAANKREK